MSVPWEKPKQYGVILLVGERRREPEAAGDNTKRCMHGARLGYNNPHLSRALGTARLPHRLPLSALKA